jgi:hypothetical protein
MKEYISACVNDYLNKNDMTLDKEQFEKVLNGVVFYIDSTIDDSISDAVITVWDN